MGVFGEPLCHGLQYGAEMITKYASDNGPCYYDGEECTCDNNGFDAAGDCPRDEYVHDDDPFMDEDAIDEIYQSRRSYDEEDTAYRL